MKNRIFLFKFQKKIYFIYSCTIILVFTLAFVVFIVKSSREVEKSNIDYLSQLNDQINNNIDIIIANVERTSLLYTIDSKVQNILSKTYSQKEEEYINDSRIMEDFISYSIRLNPYIWAISFVGINNNVYSNADYNSVDQKNIIKRSEEADKLNGKKLITPVYKSTVNQNDIDFLTFNRTIFHTNNYEKIGSINIDVDFKKIKESFYNFKDDNKNKFIIIQNNKVLFNTDSESYNLINSHDLDNIIKNLKTPDMNVHFYTKINNKNYLCAAINNRATGWWLIHYIPKDALTKYTINSLKFYFFTIILLLIIAVAWGCILTIKPIKPLNKIFNAMKSAEQGKLEEIPGVIKNDEIGMIINSYNHMVTSLKDSINREYVTQINQKSMELKMLQAQINPHFLYNTLNLISSIAELNDANEICDISRNLSDIFRYSIKEGTIVTLEDELKQINNYINIQQMRFPERYNFNFDVDTNLLDKKVIKMIIQPVIENSISHGIDPKGEAGSINISVKARNEVLILEIADNGIGMTKEKLQEIKFNLNEESAIFSNHSKNKNIGLLNVNYRIKSYYGEKYGLSINSIDKCGTTVCINIPITE